MSVFTSRTGQQKQVHFIIFTGYKAKFGEKNWLATMNPHILNALYEEREEERWPVKDLLQRPPEGGVGMSAQTSSLSVPKHWPLPTQIPRTQPLGPGVNIQRLPSDLCHNLHMSLSSLRWSRGALKYTGHINTTPPKPVTECSTSHCSRC